MKNFWLNRDGYKTVLKVNVFKGYNKEGENTPTCVIEIPMEKREDGWYAVVRHPGQKHDFHIPMQTANGHKTSLTEIIGPILDNKFWYDRIGRNVEVLSEDYAKYLKTITPEKFQLDLSIAARMSDAERTMWNNKKAEPIPLETTQK